ncbi:hypothetical protein BDV12DRAFT_191470 [Aspergillus spectabilis]
MSKRGPTPGQAEGCRSAHFLFYVAGRLKYSPTSIRKPDLLGATILDLQANEAHNYTAISIGPGSNDGGWNDTITTQVWLPLDNWNGRFQGLGGGGYSTGFGPIYLTYAVAQGFASASTDGGVPGAPEVVTTIATDLSWALSSENNVDWFLLENYAFKATSDMAEIGKQVTKSFYNRPVEYSYFSGCSGGGRQNLAMAQRFPGAFDGILAVAPAINIERFIPAGYWPTLVMNQNDIYPSPCEIDAFVSATANACDGLDGIEDGIISLPHLCNVTAFDFIGQHYTCNDTQHSLSASGAKVVQSAWSGSGKRGYLGVNKGATLSSLYIPTVCSANNTCHSPGSPFFGNWISYFVAKNLEFALDEMSEVEFFKALAVSKTDYASMLAANNPDLSEFKAQGGKMITWHGLADEAITIDGLIEYYTEVLETDAKADDFFRFFEAPGVGHCFGGLGPVPNGALAHATARDLCPYPLQQRYIGGDPREAKSFTCV